MTTTTISYVSTTSIGLVRPGNAFTWSQSVSLCTNINMAGLAMLGAPGYCATGFTFFYNDGSTKTVGVNYGGASSVLNFTDVNSLSTVDSFGGYILDVVQICGGISADCVISGNFGRVKNVQTNISSTWIIKTFWGSFSVWNGYNCLDNFGIDYYNRPIDLSSKKV